MTDKPEIEQCDRQALLHEMAQVYANATGYSENYVQFHRGLSSVSADKIRRGISAVLAALRDRDEKLAALSARRAGDVKMDQTKGGDCLWSTNLTGTSDDLIPVPRGVLAAACYIVGKSEHADSNTARQLADYSLSRTTVALKEPSK